MTGDLALSFSEGDTPKLSKSGVIIGGDRMRQGSDTLGHLVPYHLVLRVNKPFFLGLPPIPVLESGKYCQLIHKQGGGIPEFRGCSIKKFSYGTFWAGLGYGWLLPRREVTGPLKTPKF